MLRGFAEPLFSSDKDRKGVEVFYYLKKKAICRRSNCMYLVCLNPQRFPYIYFNIYLFTPVVQKRKIVHIQHEMLLITSHLTSSQFVSHVVKIYDCFCRNDKEIEVGYRSRTLKNG